MFSDIFADKRSTDVHSSSETSYTITSVLLYTTKHAQFDIIVSFKESSPTHMIHTQVDVIDDIVVQEIY